MKSLTAILMTLTIVLCSVVQFHHHDREGNIFIYTIAGEIEMGSHSAEPHHHDSEQHPCTHHHHHHDNHCGDQDDCAMHLDQLTSQEKQIDISPDETILCVVFINYILPVWHIPALSSELIRYADKVPLPPSLILPAWLMRGPPYDLF
ncbi:MAG: hypothetical protein K2M07_06965 [Muribaculaceae bacterium]|nr:hypothetical protein [Muribaculaceae bacterium]